MRNRHRINLKKIFVTFGILLLLIPLSGCNTMIDPPVNTYDYVYIDIPGVGCIEGIPDSLSYNVNSGIVVVKINGQTYKAHFSRCVFTYK